MRESDLMYSRRRFLLTSVKASAAVGAGLILGPDVFEYLDKLGPRRLLVNGANNRITFHRDAFVWSIDMPRSYKKSTAFFIPSTTESIAFFIPSTTP
jgi:hypothetical protein